MSRIVDALRRVEQMKGGMGVDTLQDAEMLETLSPLPSEKGGLEGVERVAYRPQPDNHILGKGDADRVGLERFKLLQYRLFRLRKQRSVKSVLITSAIPKEGKTMVAANLAITLAQASDRVLLVDADMRRPSLQSLLGLKPMEGLAGHLEGRMEFMDALRRVDPLGIYFLAAGRCPANPVDLLQGDSMRTAMENATTAFDWVVIDSPPILPLADGRLLASLCDAVLMVAREEHTRREELQEALAALKGTQTVGVVLNASNSANKSSYSTYYTSSPWDSARLPGFAAKKPAKGQAPNHD